MPMMTSQILKSVDFTKTQKSQYLEHKTFSFLYIKKFINYIHIKDYLTAKNTFVAEVTFKSAKEIFFSIFIALKVVSTTFLLVRF